MIPLRVSLEGFLSYKDKQVIDFTDSSLWMLWGPNGVGKSAVFDAITFALYNTHRAGGARGAKELINHYSDRLEVAFDFLIDGVMYRVRRTQSRARTARPTREAFTLHFDGNQDLDSAHVTPIPGTDDENGFEQWIQRTIGLDYRAFTSSVLLLQGKSEQLIEAEPRERYTILAELIDLSRYQRLHEAVEVKRKEYKAAIDLLTKQLQSEAARPVSDEEIATTISKFEQKDKEWVQLQGEIEQLVGWVEQAKQWAVDIEQLEEQQKNLQHVRGLLDQKDEIENKFEELQELNRTLPQLRQIVQQRDLQHEKTQRIASLEREVQQIGKDLTEAKCKKEEANQRVTTLVQALEVLRKDEREHLKRQTELAPLVANLEQIEKYQEQAVAFEGNLAQYSPDLSQRLAEAEHQAQLLTQKARVLPWLKSFAQARTDFAHAIISEKNTGAQTDALQERLRKCQETRSLLIEELTQANLGERRLLQEQSSASQRYQDACERLRNFEHAAENAVCDLCGQSITPGHAQKEKTHLGKQAQEAKSVFDELVGQYQKATEQQEDLRNNLATLEEQINGLTTNHNQTETQRQQAQSLARQHAAQMRTAFATIETPYKEYIIVAAPLDDAGWLETTYPTPSDLDVLQSEVEEQDTHKSYLQGLREEDAGKRDLEKQKAFVCDQLERLTATTDVEVATKARGEKQILEQEQQALESKIKQQEQEQVEADKLAQEASQKFEQLNMEAQQCSMNLATTSAALAQMNRTLQMLVNGLSVSWQERIDVVDADGLQELEHKCDSLAPYKELHEQLTRADQSRTLHEQRTSELEKQIASYPPGARRFAVDVEQELNGTKDRQKQVDSDRSEVNERLVSLMSQQEHRRRLEQEKSQAERQHHLYKLLSDLLGRSGLQLHLLRQSEDVIVDFANRTLSGLSHGRNRLELRRDNAASTATLEKALDLVVYDFDTGQRAIPISLASGSQRFRIAVSLALAIGRYMAREARRIESVIIDEGFGSLDKTGRDDMIQELTSLGQQLERIILVSHQDEFANAFPNRYSFKLVDKASYVTLMEDD